ncbi:MAG TPA: hypothetical protein VD884_20205 [Ohtaekwangia sp.]|nr:hypothetical protein [Ohtaekwangia sp.]
MSKLFKKLNYKDQAVIHVVNAPYDFRPILEEMKEFCKIKSTLASAKEVTFLLVFVTKQKEVDEIAKDMDSVSGHDAVFWFAYPKGTSKKYACEFNRDNGWKQLGKLGYEGVRMVAIDADWTALRFRKVQYIKTMSRGFAMSEAGKKKASETVQKNPQKKDKK